MVTMTLLFQAPEGRYSTPRLVQVLHGHRIVPLHPLAIHTEVPADPPLGCHAVGSAFLIHSSSGLKSRSSEVN